MGRKKGASEYSGAYGKLKRSAAISEVSCMTEDEYIYLREIEENCHYCEGPITTNGYSVDRRNPNSDYNLTNSVLCCWSCNQTKSNRFTYGEFVAMMEALNQHRKRMKDFEFPD